ncbi:MAG: BMP family ABC transporter substrate-binding protein [Thermotogae bacterium]|nr:MAG: BMP family ABC transporter substrate-binding protein [Thermotogota bacterium]
MKRLTCLVLILLGVFVLAAPLKVAFIYIGPAGDAGWTYAHDQGRLYIEKVFGDQIETAYAESVPEGMEALQTIRSYIKRGYKVIFATSFGYMDPTYEAAQEYPDVHFFHCSGYKTYKNMTAYFGRIYQPRFLSGLVAGMMTKTNIIGYVAPIPIPEVIRITNAFALGVRMMNPEAKVRVVWTNSWYDPATEKEAALSLIDAGADVVTQHQDSPATQQAAEEKGVYSIGYNSDMSNFAPNAYLTAPVWNWGIYYERVIREILNGTYKHGNVWLGMKDNIVNLASFSDLVPQNVRTVVEVFSEAIVDGAFDPFEGPIYDQQGNLRVDIGEKLSDEELLSMNWFVDNVEGSIPE